MANHLRTNEDWDADDWETVFGDGGYVDPTAYEVITQNDRGPVTADRIVRVEHLAVDRSAGYSACDVVALAEATDGWLTLTAWCDTTGWDCQSDGRWHWAPTRADAIRNGLDNDGRAALGLNLPEVDRD